MFPGTPF